MAQTDNSRVCSLCKHPLQDGEKRCLRCFPNAPTSKVIVKPKLRIEDWYCATCATKVPKAFQTCPVCAKTHIVCRRCKKVVVPAIDNLYVCQECYDLLQTQKKTYHSSLEKNEEGAKEPPDMIEEYLDGKSLEDAEAEQDFEEAVANVVRENRQAPAVPYTPLIGGKSVQETIHEEEFKQQIREKMVISKEEKAKLEIEQEGRGGARPNAGRPRKDAGRTPLTDNNHNTGKQPDGRKMAWTDERKAHQAELVRQGKAGKGVNKKHRTKTEASKEALKKCHAAKKQVDGRKNNGKKAAKKQAEEKPELPVSNDEKLCPLTRTPWDICKEERCGWWNVGFKACAILILSMDQKRIILKEPV